jgi:hypothetical protein
VTRQTFWGFETIVGNDGYPDTGNPERIPEPCLFEHSAVCGRQTHARMAHALQGWTAREVSILLRSTDSISGVTADAEIRRTGPRRRVGDGFMDVKHFDMWLRIAHPGCRTSYYRQVLSRYRTHQVDLSANLIGMAYGQPEGQSLAARERRAAAKLCRRVTAGRHVGAGKLHLGTRGRPARLRGNNPSGQAWTRGLQKCHW